MNDRLNFRAWFNGRFIYKSLCDSNVYTKDDKCICLANTLPVNLSWEQCTGVKDKNGRSIYAGDIVRASGFKDSYILVCRFRDGSFCLDHVDGRPYNFIHAVVPVEVIGNIHENPELTEEEEV